ncbi:MAG TPA: prepilin peptidase [Terriglobales bacterium]|nr:prepilin peptidase [Terriglobales bacterium]
MGVLFGIAIFLFGLAFGSFLNVCIHRIPRGESIVFPGSACPKCKSAIRAYDNIPLVSWLLLRGRCRHCQAPISARYPAMELAVGLLWLGCYTQFGPTPSTLKYCAFSFLIVGLVFIDAEWKLLPDALTLPGLLLGVLFSLVAPVNDLLTRFVPGMLAMAHHAQASWRLLSLADSLLGAVVGAAFIYGVGYIYLRARGVEGMGLGDVKLMAMVGAFLGVKLTVMTMFGASLLGSVFGLWAILFVWIKRTRRRMERNREAAAVARRRAWQSARMVYRYYQIPFGVFLGSMAMVSLFFGNSALHWYLEL